MRRILGICLCLALFPLVLAAEVFERLRHKVSEDAV